MRVFIHSQERGVWELDNLTLSPDAKVWTAKIDVVAFLKACIDLIERPESVWLSIVPSD